MSPVFSRESIAAACTGAARCVAIETVQETGSTNADLMGRLEALPAPVLLVAERQTAGRGRAGRAWHMEPGKTLAFSLAWKFHRALTQLSGLPLAVGVCLAEALAEWDVEARLKWPNDVLKDGGKLAGILVEAAPDKYAPQETWAVIGIGLNLEPSARISSLSETPVAYAKAPGHPTQDRFPQDPDAIMAGLLNRLADAMLQFDAEGLQGFVERWNRLHAHAGEQVVILDHGRTLHEGRAIGIDPAGRLLLETDQGQVAVLSGDVSLRPVENRKG